MAEMSAQMPMHNNRTDLYDREYLPNWDQIHQDRLWDEYLDWCKKQENGPHE